MDTDRVSVLGILRFRNNRWAMGCGSQPRPAPSPHLPNVGLGPIARYKSRSPSFISKLTCFLGANRRGEATTRERFLAAGNVRGGTDRRGETAHAAIDAKRISIAITGQDRGYCGVRSAQATRTLVGTRRDAASPRRCKGQPSRRRDNEPPIRERSLPDQAGSPTESEHRLALPECSGSARGFPAASAASRSSIRRPSR